MKTKREKFLDILEDHKGILYKIVNSYCKDESDKQDLIQEIIIQLWVSFDKYDNQYKYSTWIYRIALNTSISYYRKGKKRKEKTVSLFTVDDVPASTSVDPTNRNNIDLALLQGFIQELKEINKALILLHLDGLSNIEIADIMGISATNVSTKIGRIKTILKRKYNQEKIQHGR